MKIFVPHNARVADASDSSSGSSRAAAAQPARRQASGRRQQNELLAPLAKRAAPPQASGGDKTGSLQTLVPAVTKHGKSGKGLATKLANWLGRDKTGLTPLTLNVLPDAYAMEAVGNATSGATYTYDGLLTHDLLNLAGAGFAAAAGGALAGRYHTRLDEMLQADVLAFKAASAQRPRPHGRSAGSVAPANDDERLRYPALAAHYRQTNAADPAFVGNLIVTRDRKGQWQYDKVKLLRIAHDSSHPHTRHARDVLTLMYIGKHQGTGRRNGSTYQAVMAGLSAAASTLMIAGTHGAALPVVAAGYAVASGRELLSLRNPLAEERQKMRNAKADQIARIVRHDLKGLRSRDVSLHESVEQHDEAAAQRAPQQPEDLPEGLPLEARAGIVAASFANAEKRVANRSFGMGIAGSLIDHRKSTAANDAERGVVVNHVVDLIRRELTQTCHTSSEALTGLQTLAHDPHLSLSSRIRKMHAHVKAIPGLYAAHTLLTDLGMRKSEALDTMARLADVELAASRGAGGDDLFGPDAGPIARWINQPHFDDGSTHSVEASLHDALKRR